jgi:uncharacterized protein YegP (UPF0339 family)
MSDNRYVDYIEVVQGRSGHWFFRGKSNNGETLFTGEEYGEKDTAQETAYRLALQLGVEVESQASGAG